MKKHLNEQRKHLTLNIETVRRLGAKDLQLAAGAGAAFPLTIHALCTNVVGG